jgi:hypothetical protein
MPHLQEEYRLGGTPPYYNDEQTYAYKGSNTLQNDFALTHKSICNNFYPNMTLLVICIRDGKSNKQDEHYFGIGFGSCYWAAEKIAQYNINKGKAHHNKEYTETDCVDPSAEPAYLAKQAVSRIETSNRSVSRPIIFLYPVIDHIGSSSFWYSRSVCF